MQHPQAQSKPGVAARAITAALLSAALVCSPTLALADNGSSLEDLQNATISAGETYQAAQDKVDDLNRQIADNQSRIDELEAKLPEQKEKAAAAMRSQYIMQESSPNLLSMILDSSNLSDFIEMVTYLDNIANSQSQAIKDLSQTVRELSTKKTDLESQKAVAQSEAQTAKWAYADAQSKSQAAEQKAMENAAANEAAYQAKLASGDSSDSTTAAIAQSEVTNPSASGDSSQSAPAQPQAQQQQAQPQAQAPDQSKPKQQSQKSNSNSNSGGGSYSYVGASMYGEGDGFMYGTTASGATVTPSSMGVAMKKMPLGTVIEISYKGKTVRAVVNDRGPYAGNRQIDLQPAVAHALGFNGVGTVGYRVVK